MYIGLQLKLSKMSNHCYSIRAVFFTKRVINIWKCVPDNVDFMVPFLRLNVQLHVLIWHSILDITDSLSFV